MATPEIFGSPPSLIGIVFVDTLPFHKSLESKCDQVPSTLIQLYDGGRVCASLHPFNPKSLMRSPVKTRDHFHRVPISSHSISRQPQQKECTAQTISLKYCTLDGQECMSRSPELSCTEYSSSSGKSSPHSSYGSLTYSSPASSTSQSPPTSHSSLAKLPASSGSPPPSSRQQQPRIQVSSLLSDPQLRSYQLEIVQHPLRTAEFGPAYLSRIPITPPIIARLTVRDSSGNSVIPEWELPFLLAHLSLFSGDGTTPLDMGSFIGRASRHQPMLYGALSTAVEHYEDLQGNMGLFFLFPDVSIGVRGRYQLNVTLFRISNPVTNQLAPVGTYLAHAKTRTFEVVPLPEYVAAPTTRLTQCFIRQGARLFSNSPPYPPY